MSAEDCFNKVHKRRDACGCVQGVGGRVPRMGAPVHGCAHTRGGCCGVHQLLSLHMYMLLHATKQCEVMSCP